jgi:DnaJ-class molecular chaperone
MTSFSECVRCGGTGHYAFGTCRECKGSGMIEDEEDDRSDGQIAEDEERDYLAGDE